MRFNEELKYKEICAEMNDRPRNGGETRDKQLARWQKNYKIEKPRRGRYVIERELTEEEKNRRPIWYGKYKKWIEDFAEKRHITVLTDLEGVESTDTIEYECKCHPGIVQQTRADRLVRSIGCPLCTYPMGRFEVMLHLGLEGSLHRNKIDGVEYDIILPKDKICVEVDGLLYHTDDKESGKEDKKYQVANENGYKLIKIIETDPSEEMRIEGDKIYINSYTNLSKAKQAQIISLVQKILPYKHSDDLWDKAADYMRDWKYRQYTSEIIRQYDQNGNLVAEYKNFEEIKNAIAKGNAFGFNWTIGE